MGNDESRREENYQEYLRLKQNPDYYDVTFDVQSGGVSAIHKDHCFDKTLGPFGIRRGKYETRTMDCLRRHGHSIIMQSEASRIPMQKSCDCTIDEFSGEIKAVEGEGYWSIRTKLSQAIKQGADYVVLYFPIESLYSKERILNGLLLNSKTTDGANEPIKAIYCIVESNLVDRLKPPW